jgi:hypothetical protein
VDTPYERLVREPLSAHEVTEMVSVDDAAQRLRQHIQARSYAIDAAHVHGAQSSVIQALIGSLLLTIGFHEEEVLRPQEGFVTHARPDFFLHLGANRGVLAEVERGGTVNNNHNLKDIWKAHIAADAQHLFLIVPVSNFKPDGSARERPFRRVVHRASSFFGDERRQIDIVSLHIFGYGRSA